MSAWKRALIYIRRRKGKSIILFLIMSVCLTSALVAGSVHNKTNLLTSQLKEKLSGYFTMIPDRETEGSAKMLTEGFCRSIMEDENILAYNGIDVYYMSLPEFALTPGRFTALGEENEAHAARFISVTDSFYQEQFYLGELKVTEGEHIKEGKEGAALVSETFARENGLEIGDTFSSVVTEGYQGVNDGAKGETFSYQVKGIFQVKDPAEGDAKRAECDILNNYIFIDARTGFRVISRLRDDDIDWYRFGVNFYVKDSAKFDETLERIRSKAQIDSGGCRIEQNNGKYRQSAESLEKIGGMMGIFIIALFLLSGAVLCLMLLMWMKDRKRETGLYLAAGIEKWDVLTQLLAERLLLYLVALAAAWICAGLVMESVRKLLFTGELMEKVEGLESGIGFAELALTALGGCAVLLPGIFVSFLTVVRLNPREILSANE